jgi:hypothetical protein
VERKGIKDAVQRFLASRIAIRTKGGATRLAFPQKTGGFWSEIANNTWLSAEVADFKLHHTDTAVSKSTNAPTGSIRITSASAGLPDNPNNFDLEQKIFSWRKQT